MCCKTSDRIDHLYSKDLHDPSNVRLCCYSMQTRHKSISDRQHLLLLQHHSNIPKFGSFFSRMVTIWNLQKIHHVMFPMYKHHATQNPLINVVYHHVGKKMQLFCTKEPRIQGTIFQYLKRFKNLKHQKKLLAKHRIFFSFLPISMHILCLKCFITVE